MLKDSAMSYFDLGLNILPSKGKKPLVLWGKWQHQRQTLSEFESLPWAKADGFGNICGTQLANGNYLAVVDFDKKNVSQQAIDKGLQVTALLPTTQTENTPSGGRHYVFQSKTKPKTVKAFHDTAAVELLGAGCFCLFSPSLNYSRLNDEPPAIVDDINKVFAEALAQGKVEQQQPQQSVWFNQTSLPQQVYKGQTPICIQKLSQGTGKGSRNEHAIRIASYYLNFCQLPLSDVRQILTQWNSHNTPALTDQELESTIRSAQQHQYRYGCSDSFLVAHCSSQECPLSAHKQNHADIHSEVKTQTYAKFSAALNELAQNPDIEQFVLSEIHRTVSAHDDHVVKCVFHAALSAYNKPLNLALKCESGGGKSYTTTQTVAFMPQENILYVGSQSPKVISHENGVRKTADGRLVDELTEPQKPNRGDFDSPTSHQTAVKNYQKEKKNWQALLADSRYEVDLRDKVIVFLESVNPETFKMLKTTMSRDNEENGYVDHKYVDEHGKVHTTRLIGAPCLIFNSVDNEYVSEFASRCLTATPSTSKEKIAAAMKISNQKSSFPWTYGKENFNKKLIQEYIRKIRDTMREWGISVVNPFENIYEAFSKTETRDMRDFNKFIELIAPYAMLQLFRRPVVTVEGKNYLIPTIQDALNARETFESVSQTTKTGTDQRVISFYWNHMAKKVNGTTIKILTDEYNRTAKRKLSTRTIRTYVDRLVQIEWVDERKGDQTTGAGYVDNQTLTYYPLRAANTSAVTKNAEDFRSDLENSFKKWIETCEAENTIDPKIVIIGIDGTAKKISLEEMKQIILGEGPNPTSQVMHTNLTTVSESSTENSAESQNATVESDSNAASGLLKYSKAAKEEHCP